MPIRSQIAIQIQVVVPSPAVGRRIATALLDRHLCACVQTVGPVTSTYRWRGRVETAREWLLLIKTRTALFAKLEVLVRDLHPYEVPEIIALPIEHGSVAYLEWLRAETHVPDASAPKRAVTGRRTNRR